MPSPQAPEDLDRYFERIRRQATQREVGDLDQYFSRVRRLSQQPSPLEKPAGTPGRGPTLLEQAAGAGRTIVRPFWEAAGAGGQEMIEGAKELVGWGVKKPEDPVSAAVRTLSGLLRTTWGAGGTAARRFGQAVAENFPGGTRSVIGGRISAADILGALAEAGFLVGAGGIRRPAPYEAAKGPQAMPVQLTLRQRELEEAARPTIQPTRTFRGRAPGPKPAAPAPPPAAEPISRRTLDWPERIIGPYPFMRTPLRIRGEPERARVLEGVGPSEPILLVDPYGRALPLMTVPPRILQTVLERLGYRQVPSPGPIAMPGEPLPTKMPTAAEIALWRAGSPRAILAPKPAAAPRIEPTHPISVSPTLLPAEPAPVAPTPTPQTAIPAQGPVRPPAMDPTVLNLTDPKAIARYLVATGRVRVQPGLEGEFKTVPFYVKSRTGRNWDEVVEEIAQAKGLPQHEVEGKLFSALRGGPRERVTPAKEVAPPPPEWGISEQEWLAMTPDKRRAHREFMEFGTEPVAPLEPAPSPLAQRAVDDATRELARKDFARKLFAPPVVRGEAYRAEYERLQGATRGAAEAPRFERTEVGEQGVIPGTPGRAVPETPLRAERPQADIRETPLFGQERAARQRAMEEAQGILPSAPSAMSPPGPAWRNVKPPSGGLDRWETTDRRFFADQITPDKWMLFDRRKRAYISESFPTFHAARQWIEGRLKGFHGVVPPVPLPGPAEEEREKVQGRAQQLAQIVGLGLPLLSLLGRGPRLPTAAEIAMRRAGLRLRSSPRPAAEVPRPSAPPAVPAEPIIRQVAGKPPPPAPPGHPPIERPAWWRPPAPDEVTGWRIVQRAEGTMNWGRVFGEHVGRRLGAAIPQAYHHPVSQYLDTGRPEFLAGLPTSVRQGAQEYRDLTERYRALAQTSGLVDEGIEHYFTHILDGPPRAVAEARRRFTNARKTSPYFKARTIPTLDATEAWLQADGLAAQGVRVVRDPSKAARAYVLAYHRAEALQEVSRDLATSLTKVGGRPVLIGAEEGIHPQPAGYVAFEHPLLRSSVGNKLPLLDERYVAPVRALLVAPADPARFLRLLDTVNNLHRGITMALPWKHGLLNVGMDAMMMTGLWRGVARGEWLGTRRMGYRMLTDMDPFVEKLVRLGEVRLPIISAPLEEIRRSLSEMLRGARIPGTTRPIPGMGRLADFWEQVERVTWERMVGGWSVGLSKLLMDRMAAGQVPYALRRAGITRELWAGMSEAEQFKAVGRVITLMTGQLPRTLFADPNFVAGFRHIMFSPSWNLSNLGMVQALAKAEGTFALRGLTPVERRVVEGYMREYAVRSILTHYTISLLSQAATTTALTGGAWYLWQNPPGLRTRIYAGTDPQGRDRYAMSPFGYFVKDLENAAFGAWRLGHFDPGAAQEFVRHKLALGPRLVAEQVAGLRDPLEPRVRRPGGRGPADRITDALEDLANSFIPVRLFRQDPAGGAAATAGFWFRRAPTMQMLLGRRAAEDREYAAAIRGALRRGDAREAHALQARRARLREESQESLQELARYERARGGR